MIRSLFLNRDPLFKIILITSAVSKAARTETADERQPREVSAPLDLRSSGRPYINFNPGSSGKIVVTCPDRPATAADTRGDPAFFEAFSRINRVFMLSRQSTITSDGQITVSEFLSSRYSSYLRTVIDAFISWIRLTAGSVFYFPLVS